MKDALQRILAGQPLTPRELRIAGRIVLAWMIIDLVQWTTDWFVPHVEWLLGKL